MQLTRRTFFSVAGSAALGLAAAALPGCGGSRGEGQAASASASPAAADAASAGSSGADAASASSGSTAPASEAGAEASSASSPAVPNALVLYFSRAGENYGVGVVEKGNTAIIAEMVAENTGADLFEVAPSEPYPESYDECCDVALDEQHAGARPAYTGDFDIAPYDTIYLGYPIWWGDLPMCLYTFLEAHDWAGKEIRPFCTHAGSGLSGTEGSIKTTCAGANVGEGLSIAGTTAQNSRDEALSAVTAWLG